MGAGPDPVQDGRPGSPVTDVDATAVDDAVDTGADGPEELPPRRLGLVLAVATAVIVLDQATKHWAVNRLADGPIEVIGSWRFALAFNPGAAFSLGAGGRLGPWIAVLAIAVVATLALGHPSRFRLGAVAAGLITGGALGNLVDRAFRGDEGFLHGSVVDFIDVRFWPVFNVADSAVCIGAVLLVVFSLREP
ncbi:MAG: signal peptidase II [Actinobacteria bacterium]|nr:signal peptidase II [Actinomycetota bacterium]